MIPQILSKIEVDVNQFKSDIEDAISKLPKVSGGNGELYMSPELDAALNYAENEAGKMGDEYVSLEHILLGIVEKPAADIKPLLNRYSINSKAILNVLKEIRGNRRVTSDNPESTYDVLKNTGRILWNLQEIKNSILLSGVMTK